MPPAAPRLVERSTPRPHSTTPALPTPGAPRHLSVVTAPADPSYDGSPAGRWSRLRSAAGELARDGLFLASLVRPARLPADGADVLTLR